MANVSSSNSQGVRVPKLRFRDQNGNDYPHYQHETVGTLFSHISQRNTNMANNNVITNSAEYGLIPQREFFDKDIAVEGNTDKYYIIEQGDFVYNPRKSTTAPYGPFNCYQGKEMGIVSPLYTCLKPLHSEYTDYLLWYFRTSAWHSYIYHNGAQGGARHDRVGMTNELMDGIPVNLPCQAEQTKVSRFFSLVEERIAKQRQLVEALKSYKRGVSTALFTRKIKVAKAGESQYPEWKKRPLGEVFSERTEKARGDEKLLAVTINNGVQDRENLDLKDNSSDDKANYKVVRIGDLAYNSMRMWQGACGVSEYNGIVSPAYTVVYVADSEKDYTPFWGYYFKEIFMLHIFQRNSQGLTSDTWNLKYDKFSKIAVEAPGNAEQIHIASLLERITSAITVQEITLNKLLIYKRGLLEKMFI